MRIGIIAVTCFAVLLTGVAQGELEVGSYAPDIEAKDWLNTEGEEISIQELRGMVVVLYFWVSWHRGGEYWIQSINVAQNNPRLGRRAGVFMMGVTDADKERVEELIEDQRIFFPIALESDAHEEYELQGFPHLVIIDPDGRIAWSGTPGGGSGQSGGFMGALVEVLQENPPYRTHPFDVEQIHEYMDQFRAELRDDAFTNAYKAARSALDRAVAGDPLATRCLEAVELVEALGRDKLARANQLIDQKEFDAGVKLLKEVLQEYRSTEPARQARRRMEQLEERYEPVADVLAGIENDRAALQKFVDAYDLIGERKFGEAYVLLEEIVGSYENTSVFENAKTVLGRMKDNKAIMGYVRDYKASGECETWLSQARSYEDMGRTERARALYRKIIDKYPDTTYYEEAYRRLAKLPPP